jgi:hypothetical protein
MGIINYLFVAYTLSIYEIMASISLQAITG